MRNLFSALALVVFAVSAAHAVPLAPVESMTGATCTTESGRTVAQLSIATDGQATLHATQLPTDGSKLARVLYDNVAVDVVRLERFPALIVVKGADGATLLRFGQRIDKVVGFTPAAGSLSYAKDGVAYEPGVTCAVIGPVDKDDSDGETALDLE